MPNLGDITHCKKLGHKGRNYYIWHACIDCGKEQWVLRAHGLPLFNRCRNCAAQESSKRRNIIIKKGPANKGWKGGKYYNMGYIFVHSLVDDFFSPMAYSNGYILEHRLVMAKHLNRCLLSWEIVHHKNGIKDDNRIENLELIRGRGRHNTQMQRQITQLEKQVAILQKRVTLLEADNIALREAVTVPLTRKNLYGRVKLIE